VNLFHGAMHPSVAVAVAACVVFRNREKRNYGAHRSGARNSVSSARQRGERSHLHRGVVVFSGATCQRAATGHDLAEQKFSHQAITKYKVTMLFRISPRFMKQEEWHQRQGFSWIVFLEEL
jgi:hypothetical protein